ncbi:hypothetical protein ACEWY4_022379 [Coilia grayii]|uniref:Consortin C-terminal domain-containing protein n=1 Tax=Coilia grayii TaxID=363190 RepID=A0ABD1J7B4_9TELE
MRRRDGDETHTPKPADAMATPHLLSGSDENQNQVTKEQKLHWGSACKNHQSVTSSGGPAPSPCGPSGPSRALLASLQTLGEHSDHTLLPHSLHQIAEAYFLEEDYRWAIHFLQLERLYHQRLLSNLATLQEQWEFRWRVGGVLPRADASSSADRSCEDAERMDSLRHICRTHQRPTLYMEKKNMAGRLQTHSPGVCENGGVPQQSFMSSVENTNKRTREQPLRPERDLCKGGEWEAEEEVEDDDDDLWEEQEDEEEEGMEDLQEEAGDVRSRGLGTVDDLAKFIQVEEISPTSGLVSILKRRVSAAAAASPTHSPGRRTRRRKVRFSEPCEDDASGDSCLIFVLLCLVTVVISIGGTALYCLLGNDSTAVCADFSQNMDVYWRPVRSGVGWLTHWLFPVS